MSARAALRGALSLLSTLTTGCGTSGDLVLGSLSAARDGAGGSSASAGAAGAPSIQVPEPSRPHLTCETGAPLPLPVRRYDFSGVGGELVDLQGGPSGWIHGGAELDGSGTLTLDGDDDYVDLPNHILGEPSVTIVVWVSVVDGPAYWRIFDFGTSRAGEDPEQFTTGTHYVALTTETGSDPSGMALLVAHGGPVAEDRAATFHIGNVEQAALAAVVDGVASTAALYIDGVAAAEAPLSGPLSGIDDVNNWLGRSQYTADPYYPGVYDELRIYPVALSACEINRLVALGPDMIQ